VDELEKLKCSVAGCQNPWSVKIEAPKCSMHQWSDKKPATQRDISVATFKHPPVQHWQDDEGAF
jgi:hypothetical protein